MIARLSVLRVRPEDRGAYLDGLAGDVRGANKDEPGCRNFHVMLDEKDENLVMIYQVYKDKAAFEDHINSPHYRHFREVTKHLKPENRERVVWMDVKSFLPADKDWR